MNGRRALYAGINEFRDLPSANWLNRCVNDAYDIVGFLYGLLGFSDNKITALTVGQATKGRIYPTLQDMAKQTQLLTALLAVRV